MRLFKRGFLTASLLVLALATGAYALVDIDGRWVGTVEGPQGPGEVVLELRAEGEALTGRIGFFGMEPQPFTAGRIDGSDVSFTVSFGDGAFTLPFRGKFEAEVLSLTVEGPDGPATINFRRPEE